jgi:L-asparaginase / beta-aspartyl-peptidase
MELLESDDPLMACVRAVQSLEDDAVCNAGTGAIPTVSGVYELDASVMEGSTLRSGAVGALVGFSNPVLIALAILRDGRHHLLVGSGAADFAVNHGFTKRSPNAGQAPATYHQGNTVGAVARDSTGNVAAATSTGGVLGQLDGRLGDTPIVGAGTYADEFAACSCTGDGDAFVRACTAFWAVRCAQTLSARQAAQEALDRTHSRFHGSGGMILLRSDGTFAIERTMAAMPYAYAEAEAIVISGH